MKRLSIQENLGKVYEKNSSHCRVTFMLNDIEGQLVGDSISSINNKVNRLGVGSWDVLFERFISNMVQFQRYAEKNFKGGVQNKFLGDGRYTGVVFNFDGISFNELTCCLEIFSLGNNQYVSDIYASLIEEHGDI